MHRLNQDEIRITLQLNNSYHTHEEFINLMSELTGKPVHESFNLFPTFNTDCGKNLHFGKRVFVNSGCKFQDQGGIFIGDDVLVGHNCMIATLNHAVKPDDRADSFLTQYISDLNIGIRRNVDTFLLISVNYSREFGDVKYYS